MCKVLLKDPILKGYFNKFSQSYGITIENDADESRAFRRFINYTLLRVDTPDIFTGNADLLDFVCVELEDQVFDGFGIKLNNHLIQSIEDINQFVEKAGSLYFEFDFIRIGYEAKQDETVYEQFCKDVLCFFDGEKTTLEGLDQFFEIVEYIYTNETVACKMAKNPDLVLLYVPTKNYCTEFYSEQQDIFKKTVKEGDYFFDDISLRVVNGKEIVSFCRELENNFAVTITYKDQLQLTLAEVKNINNAISFTCQATELLKLLTKPDGTLRSSLFNDNVRDYLGSTSVNEEIEKTIIENPGMFLLCNNGITIVCRKFEIQRDKGLYINSPQIVNGCQTCSSIYNQKKLTNIERVQVQIRLICTEDFEITNQIVRGTNKQNFVLDEAFETLRPFHQDLEKYFSLRQKIDQNEVKLYYERRTKQYSNNPLTPKYQIVNLRIITQAFVGMFLGQPHVAHRHEAKLLEIFAEGERCIYCDTHDYLPYFVSAYTWYRFEEFFRLQIIPRKYKVYRAHFYLLFRLSMNMELPNLDKGEDIQNYCDSIMKVLTGNQFEKHVEMVIKMFDQAMSLWISQGRSVYGMKDHKDFTDVLQLVAGNHYNNIKIPLIRIDWQYGTIARFSMSKRAWVAIIKPEKGGKRISFGSRSYDGEVRKLIPGVRVRYKLKKSLNDKPSQYAEQVTIVS